VNNGTSLIDLTPILQPGDNVIDSEIEFPGGGRVPFTFIGGNPIVVDADLLTSPLVVGSGSNQVIGRSAAGVVSFTVSGLDSNETGTVVFTSGTPSATSQPSPFGVDGILYQTVVSTTGTASVTASIPGNGTYQVDLSSLLDGPITSTLSVSGPAGTVWTAAGNPVTLVATPALAVNGGEPIGKTAAAATPFTVTGIDRDDSGTVSFSNGINPPVVVDVVDGQATAATVDLSGLNDGAVTATLHLDTDPAGNTFQDVVASTTLDTTPPMVANGGFGFATITPTVPNFGTLPLALNNAGQVIGNRFDINHPGDTFNLSFFFSNGTFTSIDPIDPASEVSNNVFAINSTGEVIGDFINDPNTNFDQAYLYSGGTFTILSPSPGNFASVEQGINDAGQVVGTYTDSGSVQHAFLFSNGSLNTLTPSLSISSQALAINSSGEVIGEYVDAAQQAHGFLYDNGNFTTLDPGGGATH
jgi:probable HAF family extracellular repeat protein